jgi:hypothetical protein
VRLRIPISDQQQHESRRYDDPSVLLRVTGYDDVHTVGITAAARSAVWALARGVGLQLHYGGDLYFDWLRSTASRTYTDNGSTQVLSRGQYIDGSFWTRRCQRSARPSTTARRPRSTSR